MPRVLILVDIDGCQYDDRVKRPTDPEIQLLQAAADPTRLAILRQLAGGEAICACDFTACCDVAQPTVSHHLKVLLQAGLVEREQRGSWAFFRVRPESLTALRSVLA